MPGADVNTNLTKNWIIRLGSIIPIFYFAVGAGKHRFHSIFLQISCNSYLQQLTVGLEKAFAPLNRIFTKLDSDFYDRRWSKTSDRQREMLMTAIFEKVIHVVRR
jgi:hypothetical protein